jgi:hypothetical protein
MTIDLDEILSNQKGDQYTSYLEKLKKRWKVDSVPEITETIDETIRNIVDENIKSFVVYGEPQSGKTELMICLTKKLRDLGKQHIVIVMNDNVKLKEQSLKRFQSAGIDPAPKDEQDLVNQDINIKKNAFVVICKKNKNDLEKLINKIGAVKDLILIDDEADFATPNSKINKKNDAQSKINELIEKCVKNNGTWIGVTATPGRLDLNNTLSNEAQRWVHFKSHKKYIGRTFFFPRKEVRLNKGKKERFLNIKYELTQLKDSGSVEPRHLRQALFRYMINAADLNLKETSEGRNVRNYSMIVHTGGTAEAHEKDKNIIEKVFKSLREKDSTAKIYLREIADLAGKKYEDQKATEIIRYIHSHCEQYQSVVMNSKKDMKSNSFDAGLEPRVTFTVIFGGNIISRGLTFVDLISMYFARDAKRFTIDTYVQRARMFGDRGNFAERFNLTIPSGLYASWWDAFDNHHKSLMTVNKMDRPLWISDSKTRATSPASIDKVHVEKAKGEFGLGIFRLGKEFLEIYQSNLSNFDKLEALTAYFKAAGDENAQILLHDAFETGLEDESFHFQNIRNIRRNKKNMTEEDYTQIRRPRGGLIDNVDNYSNNVEYLFGVFINAVNTPLEDSGDLTELIKHVNNYNISARFFYKSVSNKSFLKNMIGNQ